MSAFASMLAAVHADTNIGTPADFRRPPGPWVPARVVLSRPTDTLGGLGGLGTRAGSLAATVLAGDIAPWSHSVATNCCLTATCTGSKTPSVIHSVCPGA